MAEYEAVTIGELKELLEKVNANDDSLVLIRDYNADNREIETLPAIGLAVEVDRSGDTKLIIKGVEDD